MACCYPSLKYVINCSLGKHFFNLINFVCPHLNPELSCFDGDNRLEFIVLIWGVFKDVSLLVTKTFIMELKIQQQCLLGL